MLQARGIVGHNIGLPWNALCHAAVTVFPLVLRGVGLAGELESRFEISLESESGGGCTSCHGLCCGHCEEKWTKILRQ